MSDAWCSPAKLPHEELRLGPTAEARRRCRRSQRTSNSAAAQPIAVAVVAASSLLSLISLRRRAMAPEAGFGDLGDGPSGVLD